MLYIESRELVFTAPKCKCNCFKKHLELVNQKVDFTFFQEIEKVEALNYKTKASYSTIGSFFLLYHKSKFNIYSILLQGKFLSLFNHIIVSTKNGTFM
jgi:hypothetical protein